MARHTKGQWRVGLLGTGEDPTAIYDGTMQIACVYSKTARGYRLAWEENARLIAAAPIGSELAALITIISEFNFVPMPTDQQWQVIVTKAREFQEKEGK